MRWRSISDILVRRGMTAPVNPSRRGLLAVGIFLLFGTVAAGFAGITILFPGSTLDRVWDLNRSAYRELAPLGRSVGIPFLVLSVTLAFASLGWFKRRLWGWRLALTVIAIQFVGDVGNALGGRVIAGGFGAAIAAALLLYLFRPSIRSAFGEGDSRRNP